MCEPGRQGFVPSGNERCRCRPAVTKQFCQGGAAARGRGRGEQVLALMIDWGSDGELLGSFGRALLPVTAVVMTIVGLFATIGPARRGLVSSPSRLFAPE